MADAVQLAKAPPWTLPAGDGSARSTVAPADLGAGSRRPSSNGDVNAFDRMAVGSGHTVQRTSSNGPGDYRAVFSPSRLGSIEVVYMVLLRIAVFTFISVAVAVTAWFAYNAAKDSEINTFLVEYDAVVVQVKQRLQDGLDARLNAAEVASAVFSLAGPDLVIPNFWKYAAGAVPLATLRSVAFVPLVTNTARSMLPRTAFLSSVNASRDVLFAFPGNLSDVLQARFSAGRLLILGSYTPTQQALAGLVAPVLQIAPLAGFHQTILTDLATERIRAVAMAYALERSAPVCSDVLELARAPLCLRPAPPRPAPEDLSLPRKRPSSVVFNPVYPFTSTGDGARGLAAVTFSWDEMLEGVVPSYLGGFGVELRGPAGATTVIEFAGSDFTVAFSGEARDKALERYKRTFTIASGPANSQSVFVVDVYPKQSFLNWFVSNRPRDTAVGVVSIVFGIGLVVTIYDVLGRLRLRTMTALAARQLKKFIVKPSELSLPPMRKVALVTAGVATVKTGTRLGQKSQQGTVDPVTSHATHAPATGARGVTGKRVDRHLSRRQAGSLREQGAQGMEEALVKAQFVLFRGTPCVLIPVLLGDDPKMHHLKHHGMAGDAQLAEVAVDVGGRADGHRLSSQSNAAHLNEEGSLRPVLKMGKGKDAGLWGIAPGRFSQYYNPNGSKRDSLQVGGVDLHRFAIRGESVKTFARAPKEWIQESNLMELCNLRHPQVATTFGASVVSGIIVAVQEYCSMGSLHSLLSSAVGDLEIPELCKIAVGVVTGCRYLHESSPPVVVNLSVQRVLIDSNFSPKVQVPFRILSHEVQQSMDEWTAPEILAGERPTLQSDVYTVGVLFYRLFADDPSFGKGDVPLTPAEVHERVRSWKKGKRFATVELIDVLRDVSTACCSIRDPGGRPALSTVDGLVNTTLSEAALVKAETARSDTEMLSQMMPKHVTDALKAGKKVEPELFEEITVFFSDIVGYTDISSTLPAEHVANMLDRLYEAFDKLALKHGLFKAETIGDAYMAMGGVPEFQADHTLRVASFAAEAVAAANRVQIDPNDPLKGNINIRVGFHTGPAVACVVGSLRPKYCLYGDTINTASRMESMSEPNRINMSLTAREALLDQAPNARVLDRGQITVKGKGAMQCFFLDVESDGTGGVRVAFASEAEMEQSSRERGPLPLRDDLLLPQGPGRSSSTQASPRGDPLASRPGGTKREGSRLGLVLNPGMRRGTGDNAPSRGGSLRGTQAQTPQVGERLSLKDTRRVTDEGGRSTRWSEEADTRKGPNLSPLSKV